MSAALLTLTHSAAVALGAVLGFLYGRRRSRRRSTVEVRGRGATRRGAARHRDR